MTVLRLVIAGGGTGGHIFPGLAVAAALTELGGVSVTFVGGERGLEGRLVPSYGYPVELLKSEPMLGGGPSRFARGAMIAARETLSALNLLRRLRPDAVLSVGGYAAGPVSLAATLSSVPLAVLEPNAAAGLTNRVLAPLSRRVYVGFRDGTGPLSHEKERAFGVPIRKGFAPVPYVPSDRRRVLVLGGSQGALGLNRALPRAIALAKGGGAYIEVLHQTGASSVSAVKEAYEAAHVGSAVVVPFIEDVASKIAWSDVIVARAGASTLAEITAIGRPMVLVPYPQAAGDHQAKNADVLVRASAAIAILQSEADSSRIGGELAALLSDPSRRAEMAESAQRMGHPDAASKIAKDLLELMTQKGRAQRPSGSRSEAGTRSQEGAR